MSRTDSTRADSYGSRARIGYTCPPLSAEVFPYEFYKLVPAGVTLVITTMTVVERNAREVEQAYEMSMRAARELAAAGVDIVFLGGVPVNLSRGKENAEEMLRMLAAELGVKVSSSVAAQEKAAKALACKNVVVAHPYGPREDARLAADAQRYGCKVLGAMGWGKVINEFGRIPGDRRARPGPRADARTSRRRFDLLSFAALAGDRSHRTARAGIRRHGDGGRPGLRLGCAAPRRYR
jgi:sugar phosphate isomerase/epimerase